MADDVENKENPPSPAAPSDPAPTSSPPINAPFGDFNRLAMDMRDGAGPKGNAPAAGPLGQVQQLIQEKAPRSKRDRFLIEDFLTPYERGLDALKARLSVTPPVVLRDDLRERIDLQRNKLIENVRKVRDTRDNDTLYGERHLTLIELNRCLIEAFGVKFEDLCDDSAGAELEGDDERQSPPSTQRELSQWYLKLSPMQQSFALAVMVLYGAKSHEIASAANELHERVKQELSQQTEQSRKKSKQDGESRASAQGRVGPATMSVDDLTGSTFTTQERRKGAEYIRWQDDAMTGRMQDFIARQATTVGMMFGSLNFLKILEQWATGDNEERAWRASLALAQLWWRQDQEHLLDLAATWADSDNAQVWQSAAALMYGGYAAEHAEETKVSEANRSVILDELRRWSDWRRDEERACVAAYSYGVLGHQWPGVSLDGLDHLLDIEDDPSGSGEQGLPLPILVFGMIGYLEIASAGHVRPVLARLGTHATRLMPVISGNMFSSEVVSRRNGRTVRLNTVLFLFLFLAATSHAGVEGKKHVRYSIDQALPAFPAFPSDNNQDLLLVGILSDSKAEDQWRESISSLFCAAICEGHTDTILEIIAQWVTLLPPDSPEETALRRFVASIVARATRVDTERGTSVLLRGSAQFQRELERWTWSSFEEHASRKQFSEKLRPLL